MADGIVTGHRPHTLGFNSSPHHMGYYVRERGDLT